MSAQKWKATADRWWINGLVTVWLFLAVVFVLFVLELSALEVLTTFALMFGAASAAFNAGWWLGERERLTGATNFRSKLRPKDL